MAASEAAADTQPASQPVPRCPSEPAQTEAGGDAKPESESELPKLSAAEFRIYNRLAEHMDLFVSSSSSRLFNHQEPANLGEQHNHFRQTWNTLYRACSTSTRPAGMSLRAFINLGLEFCHHLEAHHTIEERYLFPELAERMPLFRQRDYLLGQHAEIHKGLEGFETYLRECGGGERELRMNEMKKLMDAFGAVLWSHLDEEVEQLGADNMMKYWTLEEMRRIANW